VTSSPTIHPRKEKGRPRSFIYRTGRRMKKVFVEIDRFLCSILRNAPQRKEGKHGTACCKGGEKLGRRSRNYPSLGDPERKQGK